MKKSFIKSVAFLSALLLIAGNIVAGSLEDGGKKSKRAAESNKNISPNGNYKHNIPTSKGNRFKDSFTKAEKEKVNRNYKQQNQAKGNVKFKEHFTAPPKTNHSSYKHPQGL